MGMGLGSQGDRERAARGFLRRRKHELNLVRSFFQQPRCKMTDKQSSPAAADAGSDSQGAADTNVAFPKPEDYAKLPDELADVDFKKRVAWRKFHPYGASASNNANPSPHLPYVPPGTAPTFTTSSPALCHHVHAISGRARATTVHLPHGSVPTPVFMPVGTKGTLKGLTPHEIVSDEALNCPIILANTYHMALQPGTELLGELGGLHKFMGWDRPMLTDSGGFQMVSLLKLAEITEEGVTFENPFDNDEDEKDGVGGQNGGDDVSDEGDSTEALSKKGRKRQRMLLRPEDSIRHQNLIGSDIIMALDDVVSSVEDDEERFTVATYRTLRWLDRCRSAHANPQTQNLFPIVQGGLDTSIGGLREKCLAGFRNRDDWVPGYAIGGLAGGESKDDFWRVVDQCCRALPDDKPRYLMGVGYPLDLVVCTALGVDMYDCVYPTRTARFGVALVPGEAPGTLRLKSNECSADDRVIQEGCECQACKNGYSRARLHFLLKAGNPLAAQLMTNHNLAYMMSLTRSMRQAIMGDRYGEYVQTFVRDQFRGKDSGGQDVPTWVREALASAGIEI